VKPTASPTTTGAEQPWPTDAGPTVSNPPPQTKSKPANAAGKPRLKDADQLRQLLSSQFLARGLRDLGDPELLRRLTTARQALTPPRGRYALPRIAQGVMAFRVQGRHTPYPDLKYACYGLARATDWDNRVLLDEAQKCDDLLAAVAALRALNPPAFAACCKALQWSWDTDIAPGKDKLSSGAKENGRKLGAFLAQARR